MFVVLCCFVLDIALCVELFVCYVCVVCVLCVCVCVSRVRARGVWTSLLCVAGRSVCERVWVHTQVCVCGWLLVVE